MVISSNRKRVSRIGRVLFVSLAVLALSAGVAGMASAQCSLVTGPTRLTCPDCNITYLRQDFYSGSGWLGLFHNAGGDMLMVPHNWGSIFYTLASPAFPSEIQVDDLRYGAYRNAPGVPHRDGQNYASGYGVSSDGQRNAYSLVLPGGQTVVSVPSGNGFAPKGDTGAANSGGLVVQIKGTRYIVYGLDSAHNFFAADITNLTSFDLSNPIPSESPAFFGNGFQGLSLAEGNGKQYLYAYSNASVAVIDVSNPGPVGSITSGYSPGSIPVSAFGLPGQTFVGVSVAVDPASGNLYLLGSFWNSNGVPYFSLVLANASTLLTGPPVTYTSGDANYSSKAGLNVGTLAVNSYTSDVIAFMLFGGTTFGTSRLYATSVVSFGSPISQWADITGTAGYLAAPTILFKSPTDAYAYFWDGLSPWAGQLSCQAGPEPAGLAEDVHASGATVSNINGVLEPGETVLVNAFWKNPNASPMALAGTASAFTGPAGATYSLLDSTADYATIAPGATADSFSAGGPSYRLSVSNPVIRPATHWDATFVETLSPGEMKTWTLHVGQSFTDVPTTDVSYAFVENIFHNGITTGCAAGLYCPNALLPRWQMAIFLARSILGSGSIPAAGTVSGVGPYDCTSGGTTLFTDVSPTDVACPAIHYIYSQGITTGCAAGLYCPNDSLPRWQMAIFLAHSMLGPGVPIPVSGIVSGVGAFTCTTSGNSLFSDVPTTDVACPAIHYIYSQGVTTGCAAGLYCPNDLLPRWQMAIFLVRAFQMSFLH